MKIKVYTVIAGLCLVLAGAMQGAQPVATNDVIEAALQQSYDSLKKIAVGTDPNKMKSLSSDQREQLRQETDKIRSEISKMKSELAKNQSYVLSQIANLYLTGISISSFNITMNFLESFLDSAQQPNPMQPIVAPQQTVTPILAAPLQSAAATNPLPAIPATPVASATTSGSLARKALLTAIAAAGGYAALKNKETLKNTAVQLTKKAVTAAQQNCAIA